jgi:hypothetical protein
MERAAYGQRRIGRRTLSDRGPELRPGPQFDRKAVGHEIEVGESRNVRFLPKATCLCAEKGRASPRPAAQAKKSK